MTKEQIEVEKINRMGQLEDTVAYRYLERTDWDCTDYMTPEELVEYRKLYKDINGECCTCGEVPEDCKCEL